MMCSCVLVVKYDIQQRPVNFYGAVVFDKALFPELVHEEADPRTSGADHFRQQFLSDLGDHHLGLTVLLKVDPQQQRPREPFLAGVEELVYQIRLDPDGAWLERRTKLPLSLRLRLACVLSSHVLRLL